MRYTQKHPQHTYIKRDVYYFSRVIPSDLKHHYSKPRIIQSLKTKSARRVTVASKMLSAKLDDYWLGLRLKKHSKYQCISHALSLLLTSHQLCRTDGVIQGWLATNDWAAFFEMGLFSMWAGTVTISNNKRPLPPPLRLTEATKDVTENKRVRTRKPF